MDAAVENESTIQKPIERCRECDRETDDYIRFLNPDNTPHFVCWSCLQREEKGFNTNPKWKRQRKNW